MRRGREREFGPSYGQALAYPDNNGPQEARKARIVMTIDQNAFEHAADGTLNRSPAGGS